MAEMYILVRATEGGRIGPNSDSDSWAFDSFDKAMAFMRRDISDQGGDGGYSYTFGTGHAMNGEVAYEIFVV